MIRVRTQLEKQQAQRRERDRNPVRLASKRAVQAPFNGLPIRPATHLDWVVVDRLVAGVFPGCRPSHFEVWAAQSILVATGAGRGLEPLSVNIPEQWVARARQYGLARGVTGEFLAEAMRDDWTATQVEEMAS